MNPVAEMPTQAAKIVKNFERLRTDNKIPRLPKTEPKTTHIPRIISKIGPGLEASIINVKLA